MKYVLLALMIALAGCQPQVIYKERIVKIYPDDSWTVEVVPTSPPEKERFYNAPVNQQFEMCSAAYVKQTNQLMTCNLQLDKIEQWKRKHQAEDATAKSKED